MNEIIKNIIREEVESAMNKSYSEDELRDAIINKHFVHTKKGKVYSPVKIEKGSILGVDNDSQHVNIPLEEISMIERCDERFKK